MHPLGRYAIPTGIAFIVIALTLWVLGPVVEFLGTFWFVVLLGILIGIVVLVWRVPAAQLNAFVDAVNGNAVLKGVFIAVLFSVIYGFCLWVLFDVIPEWIQESLGVEMRWAWILMTLLGLPLIPILWRLYGTTGIPGDPKVIGKAFRGVAFLVLIFFAWWYHDQPNRLFNAETGQATFWVAKKEGKVYFFPGAEDTTKKYFSPVTGEELQRGDTADAEKYHRESWIKEASAFLPSFNTKVEVVSSRTQRITVVLRGEKVLSEPISIPKGVRAYYIGPPTATIRFGDGSGGPLAKWYGKKPGPFRFAGPKGDTVFVDLVH